jgi:hypothetical protein
VGSLSAATVTSPLEAPSGLLRGALPLAGRLLPLPAATVLWAIALPAIEPASLGEAGLVGDAPLIFFVALGVLLAGAVLAMWLPRTPGWVLAAYIGALVLILYGTIPAISDSPQYAWTYKHIGVVRLIGTTGAVHPGLDIYNRWPGMFSLAAAFSRVTGADPLTYAGWFECVFAWLEAIVVAAIAFAVTRNRRVAAMSTLVWLLTNWIGQTYFSAQALAYLLSLTMLLVIVRQFPVGGRLHVRIAGLLGSLVRRPQPADAFGLPLPWRTWQSVVVVVVLDAAVVATHQLTPYMVVLQVGALTALGLRPRWLVFVIAGLAAAYLAPNLDFVQSHYGLLGGNPIDNAQVDRAHYHRAWFYANVGGLLSYTTLLLAALGGLRLARVGLAQRAIPVAALALVPFVVLLGSNYGGEGVLRAFLFSSPWLAILIAWGLSTLREGRQLVAAVLMSALLCGLFLFAFIGNAGTNVIPASEVAASDYFYSHARPGSVLMLAGEDFPLRVGANYGDMAGPAGDHSPNLLEDPRLHGRPFKRRDLRLIAADMLDFSPVGYLVFSTTQNRYARFYDTTSPWAYEELERWVAASPKFALWHASTHARIYRLRITKRCQLAGACRGRPSAAHPLRHRSTR